MIPARHRLALVVFTVQLAEREKATESLRDGLYLSVDAVSFYIDRHKEIKYRDTTILFSTISLSLSLSLFNNKKKRRNK